ncbi:metal-dependent hydrolase [Zooshikella sp. RANM57]|uniref:metal-dependent hydrolase n=1 Tax=Zooshikella sp. RANM57 TaxID=3425863 RepID=UPI003D6E2809
MATIITHVAVPLVLRMGIGKAKVSTPLLIVACLAAILPDADVIAFKLGIPYASSFGHRGFSHSLLAAVFVGLLASVCYKPLKSDPIWAFFIVSLSMASHGVLDSLTNGGLGIAFLWPESTHRYFLPWRPIEVSPIGIKNFFTARGLQVILSEIVWVWFPCLTIGVFSLILRKTMKRRREDNVPLNVSP